MADNDELNWPRRRDVAFGPGTLSRLDRRNMACVDSLLARPNLGSHANAFKEAASMIVTNLSEGGHDPFPCDPFFFPVAYLYRHAIELLLKEAIGYAVRLDLISHSKQLEVVLSSHNLYGLWNKLKPGIKAFWPDAERDSLCAAERIVAQFHRVDKTGQALRYPTAKDGAPLPTADGIALDVVNLQQLGSVAGGLCNFLNGCISGFDEAWSNMPRGEW